MGQVADGCTGGVSETPWNLATLSPAPNHRTLWTSVYNISAALYVGCVLASMMTNGQTHPTSELGALCRAESARWLPVPMEVICILLFSQFSVAIDAQISAGVCTPTGRISRT